MLTFMYLLYVYRDFILISIVLRFSNQIYIRPFWKSAKYLYLSCVRPAYTNKVDVCIWITYWVSGSLTRVSGSLTGVSGHLLVSGSLTRVYGLITRVSVIAYQGIRVTYWVSGLLTRVTGSLTGYMGYLLG